MPRVTVAICTYNRAHYLAESLQSVIDQTYKDIAIIVYDNASTDNTEAVVRSFSDPRVDYIKNEKNISGVGNLNKALSCCKTEFLVIFHDDDIMLPHMIETEVAAMDKYPNTAICGQMYSSLTIDSNSKILTRNIPRKKKYLVYEQYDFINECLKCGHDFLTCPSVMFNMSFIKKEQLRFDVNCGPAADWLLWLEINMYQRKIVGITRPIMKYRIHEQSDSQVSANKTGVFNDSHYYIQKWLISNDFKNLEKLYDHFIFIALQPISMDILKYKRFKKQEAESIINNLRIKYSWNLSSQAMVINALLNITKNEVIYNKIKLKEYIKIKNMLERSFNLKTSNIYDMKFYIKYFFNKIYH